MTELLKISFVFCVLISHLNLYAQTKGNRESDIELENTIINYQKSIPGEQAYLQTDRSAYVSGDYIWVKAYLHNLLNPAEPPESGILYADLANPSGKIIDAIKLKLIDNRADGQIYIPDTLPTGVYTLRAYTNWMRNFESSSFFHSSIFIVNRFDDKINFGLLPKENANIDCKFYPEGGKILVGKCSKIAYKLCDSNNSGINLEGWIEDENGIHLNSLLPAHCGIGSFEIVPAAVKKYFAVFLNKDKSYRFKLPDASLSGFSLRHHYNEMNKTHEVEVFNSDSLSNEKFYLVSLPTGSRPSVQSFKLAHGYWKGALSPFLNDGIVQIFLLETYKNPVCDRMFFNLSPQPLKLTCVPSKKQYGLRDSVELQITLEDPQRKFEEGNFSISVTQESNELRSRLKSENILSQTFLQSYFPERIEDAGWYFEEPDSSRKNALDNLLISLSGKKDSWDEIGSQKPLVIEYCQEKTGLRYTGRIVDKILNTGIKGIELMLASPDTFPVVDYAITGENGQFLFDLEHFYGMNHLILQARGSIEQKNMLVTIDNPLAPADTFNKPFKLQIDSSIIVQIMKELQRSQISKSYQIQTISTVFQPSSTYKGLKCYGIPDATIFPHDFIKLTDFEEIVKEIVTNVTLSKKDENYSIKVFDPEEHEFNMLSTLLVDGIPIKDINSIMQWSSDKIKKIEICHIPRRYGDFLMGGVISIFTTTGTCPIVFRDALFNANWTGFHKSKLFPEYSYSTSEEKHSTRPDFRNLLYWNPSISIGNSGTAKVHFTTADESTSYSIIIEGFSKDGRPLKLEMPIIVRKQDN